MKLLYCEHCGDVFQPSNHTFRTCECGRVKGRYLNDREVAVSPEAISIALDNKSLLRAIDSMRSVQQRTNNTANRDEYMQAGKLRAWVRPNSGPGNPNSYLAEVPKTRQFKTPADIFLVNITNGQRT